MSDPDHKINHLADIDRRDRRRALLYGALVFIAALAARLGYLTSMETSPYYDLGQMKGSDPYSFFTWALAINDYYGLGEGVYYQSPFYPYFLALILKLAGGGNVIIPRFVQFVMGSGTALIAFLIGRRLKGDLAGVVAGFSVAFYGPLIMYEGTFLRDGPVTFLYMAFMLALLSARRRPGLMMGLLCGALYGVCVIGKPNILVFLPVIGWSFWMAGRSEDAPDKGRQRIRARLMAGAIVGAALAMSPLIARNLHVGVPPLSITKSGPLEFIAGNIPETPPSGLEVNQTVIEMAREAEGSTARAIVLVLKHYKGRYLDLVERVITKAGFFLSGYEVPNNLNYYIEKKYVGYMRLPWITWPFLLGACVVGMWAMKREWRQWLELYLYLALFSLGTIAFFVVGRFKAPLIPVMGVFAGAGVAWTLGLARERRWLGAGCAMATAIMIVILVWPRVPDVMRPNDYLNMVLFHLNRREPDAARKWVDDGIRKTQEWIEDRDDAEAHYGMARLKMLAGEPLSEVESELVKVSDKAPAWVAVLVEALSVEIEWRKSRVDEKPGGFRMLGAHQR